MIEIYIYKADVNKKNVFGVYGIGKFVSKAKLPNHITINQIYESLIIFKSLLELDNKHNFIIGVFNEDYGRFEGFYCSYESDIIEIKNIINNIVENLNEK